ncbi:hypothetical protein S40293_10223 [Stachybotrys chartarum IBT 40293]|nr:hypothetical protein S40293_10223 [Stachybotrys chartarum IBT 40293]
MLTHCLWLLAATGYAACTPSALGGNLNFDFPDSTSPVPFDISVTPEVVNFAKGRASTFRNSYGIHPEWTNEGALSQEMAALAKYWAEEYDWPTVQDKINRLEHFATTVPGNRNYSSPIPIHFIYQRSTNESAVPLLLLHGWSSTHLEWTEIIEPLTEAFHIIAPDLPGFGFSPAPSQPGLGPREMGIAFDAMMKQLGYNTYGLVITDLGYFIGSWMAIDVANSVIGLFTDFVLIFPTDTDRKRQQNNQTTPEEDAYILAIDSFTDTHSAYSIVQGQKPLALSYAMADSPVGFAAWLWDLKYAGSDGYDYSYQEIITDSFLLWIQEPYTSMRAYIEFFLQPENMAFPKSSLPAAVTEWGSENGPFPDLTAFGLAPLDWAERVHTVNFFRQHTFGGHFPALSEPDLYASEVREFFFGLGN